MEELELHLLVLVLLPQIQSKQDITCAQTDVWWGEDRAEKERHLLGLPQTTLSTFFTTNGGSLNCFSHSGSNWELKPHDPFPKIKAVEGDFSFRDVFCVEEDPAFWTDRILLPHIKYYLLQASENQRGRNSALHLRLLQNEKHLGSFKGIAESEHSTAAKFWHHWNTYR